MKSRSKTEKNRKIYPYNNKLKLREQSNKSLNKKVQKNIKPLNLDIKINNNEINDSLKNDSLSTLRKYIPSSKPYIVTSSIRNKIKYIKMIENGVLDNFYSSTIKASSARYQKNELLNKYFKDNSYSFTVNNKPLKFKNERNINKKYIEKEYQTLYNISHNKNQRKRNLSNQKKIINFSKFSDGKTDYSSLPTAALTTRNFYKKSKYLKFNLDNNNNNNNNNNNYYDDSLGYKNANMKEPTYAKKGTIRSFMNEISNIRKDNYKNYYLKLHEFKKNILNENILCQIQLDERTKKLANYYLNKYNDGYNIYWYKLKKKINKEYDINDNLKYQIKNLKIEISKLTLKIQKLLIKLNIFIEIKDFLFELKEVSSYPCGTPYNQLMELKNKLMEKIENNEEQTNLNIYLLNNKEIGIDLFINKYKNSLCNKNENIAILSTNNEFIDIPNKLDSNIKNLLWTKNILGKEIDSLKITLYEILENSKNEQIYENTILNRYNNYIKIVSHLKTENDNLNYKIEQMKKKTKNDKNGKLDKNVGIKIMKIFNNFMKYQYITDDDNFNLNKNFAHDTIKYLLVCLTIIEKNIINLLKFKNEVIYKDPLLKKKYELNSKYEAVCRTKKKEQNERYMKIRNTIDKLNKIKYLNEKKDYYKLNRAMYIKKTKKISKEKEKNNNEQKTPIEIMMDIV